ncbi:MAG TPA: TonB-dependent receptor [Rhodocyclaceae bacterium]|nr:TonB-dependent receptor [Rhodocyclaceae bacterium]
MKKHLRPLPLALLVAGACAGLAQAADQALGEVTVTGTREGQLVAETPATVDVIKEKAIREVRPTHPSEIMGQVPGVWVNVTGGEGHQTAIRQPLTTAPVYLYLEDGVPTRATGFFNHNALYEVNIPQAGGIEISKGPGSALYGSDAIGGVVNVLTRKPPAKAEMEASAEAGSYGWGRVMVSAGNSFGDDAFRASLNLTHTDGWRQRTGYDRQAGTLRWDRAIGDDAVLKTVFTFSDIDQQTAGSSALSESDYKNSPRTNYTPISFRKVNAYRLSAAYEKETADTLLSITPYYRNDSMDLLANWTLGYDPTVYNTSNESFGLLLKYRMDFAPMRARLIVGADIDNSPGSRKEDRIAPTSTGAFYTRVYTGYTTGARVYDYDVTYRGISPYVHGEISPADKLRVTAGLRYDNIRYSFDNRFGTAPIAAGGAFYGQVGDTSREYNHLSPKLGATYAFTEQLNGFAAYTHGFRAPSEGQLFRPSAANTALRAQAAADAAVGLKPIKVDSFEVGVRGKSGPGFNYEASVYHMVKTDDILNYRDPVSGATTATNAGKTRHQGIELGAGWAFAPLWRVDGALSYARHTYQKWVVSNIADYSGKEMEIAPRTLANARVTWGDAGRAMAQLEWVHVGSWWSDQLNTFKYGGHDIFNLRGQYPVAKDVKLFANVHNLLDKRYAESTGTGSGAGGTIFQTFAPGLPRTLVAGVEAKW